MKTIFTLFLSVSALFAGNWKKHTIAANTGAVYTAIGGDFNQDGLTDVISSYSGLVMLFTAPDWDSTVIHSLEKKKDRCIHGDLLDVDQDGDLDVVLSKATGAPFWLENPDNNQGSWTARIIDPEIKGIHCILAADVDSDGHDDIIINNFKPEGTLGDSLIWLKIPPSPKESEQWRRFVFAKGDAPGGSHYFGFGDLDGDGQGEIATGAKGAPFEFGNWFAYWSTKTAPTDAQPWKKEIITKNKIGASNILIGDLNGDQQPDFLTSNGHGQGVAWFEAPDWTPHSIDDDIQGPHSLTMADFDQDGDLDGATCSKSKQRTCIYQNDGQGHFTRLDIDQGQSSYDLRAIDMDQDGDLDLLNAGLGSKNIVWYENPLF